MILIPKNLIETAKMKAVMDKAKEVYNFISTHCINGIRVEMINARMIDERTSIKNVVDTMMNLIEIHLSFSHKQSTFLAALPQNARWMRYYNERNQETKKRLDQIL